MSFAKIITFITLVLEGYLFTGIIFGFPNLVKTLKDEGVWTANCTGDIRSTGNVNSFEFFISFKIDTHKSLKIIRFI